MNAMTLLRAMSAIDPKDIAAAGSAAASAPAKADIRLTQTTGSAEAPLFSAQESEPVSAGRRYAIGGWAAAAACVALLAAAGLYFRHGDDQMLMPSETVQVTEIAAATTAETVYTQMAESSTVPAQTGTDIISSAAVSAVTDIRNSEPKDEINTAAQETEGAPSQTTAAETTAAPAETAPPPVVEKDISVLVATADGSGSLFRDDGTPLAQGEFVFERTDNAADIRAYLDGPAPSVTLGTGRKTDDVRAAILAEPVLLHIRWQMPDDRWTSYGVQHAELTADGILHLTVCMYTDGEAAHPEPWVYETALLCEAGSVPAVTGAELTLQYYEDTAETGIQQFILYSQALDDDVMLYMTGA